MTDAILVRLNGEEEFELIDLQVFDGQNQEIDFPETFQLDAIQKNSDVNQVVTMLSDELMATVGEYKISKSGKKLSEFNIARGRKGVIYTLVNNDEPVYKIHVTVGKPVIETVEVPVKVPVEVPVKAKEKVEPEYGILPAERRKGFTAKTLPTIFNDNKAVIAIASHSTVITRIEQLKIKVITTAGATIEMSDDNIKNHDETARGVFLDDIVVDLMTTYEKLASVFKIKDFSQYTTHIKFDGNTAIVIFEENKPE